MPRPPNFDGFDDIKFITNYFLMGCSTPAYLVVDFSKEPLWDVALLICSFDVTDIAQSVLEPGGQRHRRSGRHGRKSGRRRASLDPNEFVGAKIRAKINPIDVMQHSPLRRIFPLINAYEGVAFTAAVADGFTDVGFETLWGILNVQPENCREFARFSRSHLKDAPLQTIPGAGPPIWPVTLNHVDFANSFSTTNTAAACFVGQWALMVTATIVRVPGGIDNARGKLTIGEVGGPFVASSGEFSIDYGDVVTMTVSYECQPGQFYEWGLSNRHDGVGIIEGGAVGYLLADIFQ